MSYKITKEDDTVFPIELTRGDTLSLQLELTKNGEPYAPEEGDSIRFAIWNKNY